MAQKRRWQSDRTLWVSVVGAALLTVYPMATDAQIAGDGSLGTQVNGAAIAPCTGNCIITNGATRGSNLFHSLRQFSLPNGDFAGFITTPAIQNVIVRVTGVGQPFISNINGTIATSNPANFFLLNPNGILFGPGAALNIGGSFLATTANRMQFADGTEFRTDAPAPLLTISLPIGLQFGPTPGAIQARGMRLSAGQTDAFGDFALVGGDVTLDDSVIRAPGRQITLGGVDENGTIGLWLASDRLSLSLAAGTPRRDITLTDSVLDSASASSGGGGAAVIGRNIILSQSFIGTAILPGIDNAATNQAGDITINAAANLQLTQESLIANSVRPNAIGQGGNISITASNIRALNGSAITANTEGNGDAGSVQVTANTIATDGNRADGLVGGISNFVSGIDGGRGGAIMIKTDLLTLTNGANVSANTYGNGKAGNVRILANTILLDSTTPDGFASGIFSQVSGSGSGGEVTVETASLTITNGAAVSASTFENGDAGNVRIAADTIVLDGTTPDGQFSSAIASTTRGIGRGGDVTVETGSLTVVNGAAVTASTAGNGSGGNVRVKATTIALDGVSSDGQSGSGIASEVAPSGSGRGGTVTIETGSLTVTNGAHISASTAGNGDAGNVRVIATTIALDGTAPDSQFASGIASAVGRGAVGRGGEIAIETDSLIVSNGAAVTTASASSDGSAGNLDITARTLRLDRGDITAQATSGDGANITLTVRDLLLMRNESRISASAGTAQAGGDGGNISIRTPFIVGVLSENSDITANAFTGRGGNITITTNAIYGLQFQPQLTPLSDITASSRFGINGIIDINTLNLDPSRGLIALPVNLTDPSQQISQSCTPGSKTSASSFVATGRGGIPLSPDEPLESRAVVTKWVPLPEEGESRDEGGGMKDEKTLSPSSLIPLSSKPIVEAQSVRVGTDGVVELVANVLTGDRDSFLTTPVLCQTFQEN